MAADASNCLGLPPLSKISSWTSWSASCGAVHPVDQLIRPVLPHQLVDCQDSEMAPPRDLPSLFGANKSKPKRPRTERRREQCRANQARYRARQHLKLQHREQQVRQLREQIRLLALVRPLAFGGRQKRWMVANRLVAEFFRCFRYGLAGATADTPVFTPSFGGLSDAGMKQAVFLYMLVAPDADVSGLWGPDALVEQWWRYSSYFTGLLFELESMELVRSEGTSAHLNVLARLDVTVTSTSIDRVFPLLSGSELADQLVDMSLNLYVRLHFEVEASETGLPQVTNVDTEVEWVPALQQALETLNDVADVMRGALISPHGWLGELEDHPAGNSFAAQEDPPTHNGVVA